MRMKRLFTLLLVTMGMVCTANADVSFTVNFASDTEYTMKVWVQYGTDDSSFEDELILMTNSEKTYDSKPIYTATINKAGKNGIKNLYFQAFDGSTWKWEDKIVDNSWTTDFSYFNGKLKVAMGTMQAYNYDKTIIFHCKKTNDWTPTNAYFFYNDGTSNTSQIGWPGESTIQSTLNSDWYDYTMTNKLCTSIIFNNGKNDGSEVEGTDKTISLAVGDASEYWITGAPSSATITSTLPADDYKYTRSVTPGSYGTICLPYNATIEGATVYSIAAIQEEVDEPKRLCFVEKENVIAGYAYLFQAGEGNQLTATFTSNTKTSSEHDDGMLGNLSPDPIILDGSETAYVIQGNVIKKVVSGGTGVSVPQYRAYITLKNITTSAPSLDSNFIFIPFEDAPSGINTVHISESKINGYYNLNGQRVAQPTKGLYIVNGKKVVLK